MTDRRQYKLRPKRCERCSEIFTVVATVWHKARYCPKCRPRHRSERENQRQKEQRATEPRKHTPREPSLLYKMVCDPEGAWGNNTHLSREAITLLCMAGNIEEGCEFEHVVTGCRYRIVLDRGKLVLTKRLKGV